MAKQLFRCVERCAWFPTPPNEKGQPTSAYHCYDPQAEDIPPGRDIPMSMEWLDPDDPWTIQQAILDHFVLPEEATPESEETTAEYMSRCRTGVRAPSDPGARHHTKATGANIKINETGLNFVPANEPAKPEQKQGKAH